MDRAPTRLCARKRMASLLQRAVRSRCARNGVSRKSVPAREGNGDQASVPPVWAALNTPSIHEIRLLDNDRRDGQAGVFSSLTARHQCVGCRGQEQSATRDGGTRFRQLLPRAGYRFRVRRMFTPDDRVMGAKPYVVLG